MATAISTTFGEGGSGLTPGGNGTPTLASALRDAADDLAALQGANVTDAAASAVSATEPTTTAQADASATAGSAVSAFAVADIAAFTDPPSAAEMALLRTFVNSLKTNVNLLNTRVEAAVTATDAAAALATALKAKVNTTITYALDVASQSAANRLLANAFRTVQRARYALTMGLTKA